MTTVEDDKLLLQQAYAKEKIRGNKPYLTQPMGNGTLETYTWSRFMAEARRIASYIRSQKFPPGSHIAILSKNCAHFLMTDMAIWMAGHVSVALYPTLNANTVRYILEHSDAKMLFVGKLDGWDDMKIGVPKDLPLVSYPLSPPNSYPTWDDILDEHEPLAGTPTRSGDDIAIIMYTSGSTGRPKGVMHSFRALSAGSALIISALHISSADRMLSYLPLAHALERWLVGTTSLLAGHQIFFAESRESFVADLQRARPTLFISVPRLWAKFQAGVFQKIPENKLRLLLKVPIVNRLIQWKLRASLGLQETRIAGSGSAPIAAPILTWYQSIGLEILEGYGMSENFNCSHLNMPGDSRVGTVGRPYPGVQCKLSEDGEILVKSPTNMIGYYKDPEASKRCLMTDGFLRTGDRGEIDQDGRLKITGRTKEMFKTSKGKYVSPAPIENIINSNSNVELSCVSGSGRPRAFGLIMLSEDLYNEINDPAFRRKIEREFTILLNQVNSKIEDFEQLQFFAIATKPWRIEDNLLTPTQKIKRNEIEELIAPSLPDWYQTQEKIIWQEH